MLKEVIVGCLINLITAILSVILLALILNIRRMRLMKDFRRFINPSKRVFIYDGEITGYVIDETSYFSVYTEEEVNKLVFSTGKKNLFNGRTVRLDNVDKNGKLHLSEVGFFDLLVSNMTYLPANKNLMSLWDSIRCYLSDSVYRETKNLEARIGTRVKAYGKLKTVSDVLAVKELANTVAVSVLLEDCNGELLLVKRGNKVVISSGSFAVSAAGSVSVEDLETEDPFKSCAKREVEEELGLHIDLEFDGLVVSKQKLQPVALYRARLPKSFRELSDKMKSAPDFNEENEMLLAVPKFEAMDLVKKLQFTDIAAYQIYKASQGKRKKHKKLSKYSI